MTAPLLLGEPELTDPAKQSALIPLAAGQAALLAAYLLQPTLYPLVAFALVVLYMLRLGRAGSFLAFVQVVITAGYGSQREMPHLDLNGLAFTTSDLLALPLIVVSLIAALSLVENPASRRLTFALLAWITVMFAGVLRTFQMAEDMGLAVRNFRPYLYLLIGLGITLRILRGTPLGQFVVAVNLAAAAACVALLAHVLHYVTLIGFDTKALIITSSYLERIQIIDETLIPGLVAVALASVLFTRGPTRLTGGIATPLLLAALIASPGRGAIFASAVATGALFAMTLVWRPVEGPRIIRRPVLNVAVVAFVSLLVLNGALSRLAGQGQDINVIQGRTAEALLPWSSHGLGSRVAGWKAADSLFETSPVLGHGLGHVHPELARDYDRDFMYNVPTTIGNVAGKVGLLGLIPMLIYFVMLSGAALKPWRGRRPGAELVAAPVLLALFMRSLSDDVMGSLGVGVLLSIALAGAVMANVNSRADA